MTEDQERLLAVFEVRLRDLVSLCNVQKQQIEAQAQVLGRKDEELKQAMQTIEEITTKYDNLLTAKVLSAEEGEIKKAKSRLSGLVREVDKCIALLNE